MKITTASGAVYLYDGKTIERHGHNWTLRRDGERLKGRIHGHPTVGHPMVIFLEPLALGADVTVRRTTPVTNIVYETE